MPISTILADIQLAAGVVKMAIDVGTDMAPYVEYLYRLLSGQGGLTDQERADLEAKQAALEDLIANA